MNDTGQKPFYEEVTAWLRGGRSIEYAVNGDFYDKGEVKVSGGAFSVGSSSGMALSYLAVGETARGHYEYCYVHETQEF